MNAFSSQPTVRRDPAAPSPKLARSRRACAEAVSFKILFGSEGFPGLRG